jgi:nickel/cobalt transporter (NicO) family protein
MKLKFFSLMLIIWMVCAVSLWAHPLGNFSVNQFSRLEVGAAQIKIRQVLDMAEIPTFQLKSEIDRDGDGVYSQTELDAYAEKITPDYLSNLRLTVNQTPLKLRETAKNIGLLEGEANLPILRVEWDLIADLPDTNQSNRVAFENKNFTERIGWNEIVVGRASGINVFDSTAYGSGVTNELESYPEENLSAPLAERAAAFSFTTGAIPAGARLLQNRDGQVSAPAQKDRFAELISVPEITPSIVFFGLLLAFGLGALHALSPGHGKAVVGAYLVGSRGTPKHAAFLGLTVTVTHTLGVFALGLVTLFASNYILPEKIMPFLSFVSGLLVFFIGATLFKNRLFAALGWQTDSHHHHHDHHHDHPHSHDDDHAHDHHSHSHGGLTHTHGGSTHTHLPPENVTWKSLLALGISGGLLPCPSALVLMLSAISLDRVGYGIILTLVFSLGLAATLTAVGLVFLYLGKAFGSSALAENRLIKTLPVVSALVIASVGAVICYNSLA